MYSQVKAKVRTQEGMTDTFNCPLGLKQGCTASPILFSLFINDFVKYVDNSNLRGIQLFPDITEILLLLFSDDLALLSDTVIGLQRLINMLAGFCLNYKLKVNISKDQSHGV